MKALVLDFDGVVSDSAREAFEVALRTYEEMAAGAPRLEATREMLWDGFLDLMPLGNRAEDYGATLIALALGIPLRDQAEYDAFRSAQDPAWLRAFHKRFYQVRTRFAEQDPAGWRRLLAPYARLLDILRRRAGEVELAIATAKDRASVRRLLRDYGVDDLFGDDRVLDKETGVQKTAHLEHLHRTLQVAYPQMTFVDDKVNHLDSVAPLGVRCALAAWGYNGEREEAQARARGYLVCRLADVERQLFG